MSPKEVADMLQDASSKAVAHTPPLDFCHDIYCDSDTYQVPYLHITPYGSLDVLPTLPLSLAPYTLWVTRRIAPPPPSHCH